MNTEFSKSIAQFSKKKILIIGDVMLDEYRAGTADRISPEAPIPVLLQKSVRYVLGGAGNVAANVAALGASATLVGVLGNDGHAKVVRNVCREKNIAPRFLIDTGRPTTTKIRFVSGHHQLVRIDIEDTHVLMGKEETQMVALIRKLSKHDFVIVSDYAKGCLTKKVMHALRAKFGAHRIIADMKPHNAPLFVGICAITPNVKEATELSGITALTNAHALRAVKAIEKNLQTSVILTRGEYGVTVFDRSTKEAARFRSDAHSVKDVTGAGDTLVAVMALMIASGATLLEATELANLAAGAVVGVAGTHALSKKELDRYLKQN
ncbi:MAG: PfkB family carbohydrate kinase [bacterium]|nr:PfkB family carbohydrate kinase [bacterium]